MSAEEIRTLLQQAREARAEGRHLVAGEAYLQAAALAPEAGYGLHAAISLRDAGQTERALALLQAYLEAQPDSFDGWVTLGMTLRREGRFAESVLPLSRALELREDAAVINAMVMSCWKAGDMAQARALGLRNLHLKDRLAHQAFAASPFATMGLSDVRKGFDPERSSRNVIAFSLWGDRPEYITGAIVNAQIAQHVYVRWSTRFYCAPDVPADARAALAHFGAQVILMDRPGDDRFRPMWRFLVSDDPEVNVFLCRDADSRLNVKEALAVQDWLASGLRFHVMRDHLYHMELMLAGMWGGTAGVLPNIGRLLRESPEYFDSRFGDQAFLMNAVWPMIRGDTRVHDTFYGFPDAGPFPPGYEFPGAVHVGGAVKAMPHWHDYLGLTNPAMQGARLAGP